MTPKYLHGWGRCPVCGRRIAAMPKGGAWRHGRRDRPCAGSGRGLLKRRMRKLWAGNRLFGV